MVMVLAVAATLAAANRCHAAPRDPKAAARVKLIEGAQLLSSGEYEEALARFQEAYASVPSPKIFYNYGLAYRGLGRNAEAITWFDRFLAEARDAASDKRGDAERRRTEPRGPVAGLMRGKPASRCHWILARA
jgi:tetratricopeptide (TPR) repeat protein